MLGTTGCSKYLDVKSDQSLVIISTLKDMQSVMDDFQRINVGTLASDNVSCDDYYLTYIDYQSMALEQYRNMYVWHPSNHFSEYVAQVNDWGQVYNNIYIANIVLSNIYKVERTTDNAELWDNIKGQAHFLRAYSLYKAATVWCLAYDENTSSDDLGLPLRLDPDINIPSKRSSVLETYNQILSDAQLAADLLPSTPLHVSRSAKPAAYALLAKIYLAMRNYELAFLNADNSLKLYNALMDYNLLNQDASFPINLFNDEVLYHTVSGGVNVTPVGSNLAKVDTLLFDSYHENDLRKAIFFQINPDGSQRFKGSYSGSTVYFNGIATDEVYLTRAECNARLGNTNAALSDLNTLLGKRYRTGTFIPITVSNNSEALSIILDERRKELLMRGSRWIDIKRQNKEGAGITLKRILNDTEFTLSPNDLRFALPLPDDVIELSGMQQNPR